MHMATFPAPACALPWISAADADAVNAPNATIVRIFSSFSSVEFGILLAPPVPTLGWLSL